MSKTKTKNMKNEFVPYDIALAMKELGFDEACLGMYYDAQDGAIVLESTWVLKIGKKADFNNEFEINAPLYQQAFRWFREKYGLWGWVEPRDVDGHSAYIISAKIGTEKESYWRELTRDLVPIEESELACLRKLIEICSK